MFSILGKQSHDTVGSAIQQVLVQDDVSCLDVDFVDEGITIQYLNNSLGQLIHVTGVHEPEIQHLDDSLPFRVADRSSTYISFESHASSESDVEHNLQQVAGCLGVDIVEGEYRTFTASTGNPVDDLKSVVSSVLGRG